jgi:hypothetical protein
LEKFTPTGLAVSQLQSQQDFFGLVLADISLSRRCKYAVIARQGVQQRLAGLAL